MMTANKKTDPKFCAQVAREVMGWKVAEEHEIEKLWNRAKFPFVMIVNDVVCVIVTGDKEHRENGWPRWRPDTNVADALRVYAEIMDSRKWSRKIRFIHAIQNSLTNIFDDGEFYSKPSEVIASLFSMLRKNPESIAKAAIEAVK